jgi:uncharacterized membrane protein
MWFFEALFFSLWTAVSVFLIKKWSSKIPSSALILFTFLFTLPWMVILILITGGFPKTGMMFYLFMLGSAIFDVIAFYSYFRAIKLSEISLIGPISSFGPVFTTLFAFIALNEAPSGFRLIGILLIVVGSYILNLVSNKKDNLFASFINPFRNKGVLLALFAAFLWSITPIFQKQAIFLTNTTTPLFASFVGMIFVTIYFLSTNFSAFKKYKQDIKSNLPALIIYGLGSAIAQLAAYSAFASSYLGYVTAIMRSSGIFTVIIGGIFLKEKTIGKKIIGSLIMLAGVLLLAI